MTVRQFEISSGLLRVVVCSGCLVESCRVGLFSIDFPRGEQMLLQPQLGEMGDFQ